MAFARFALRTVALAVVGASLFFIIRFASTVGLAYHPYAETLPAYGPPHRHISGLNFPDESEDWCVKNLANPADHWGTWNAIMDWLYAGGQGEPGTDQDWEGIKNIDLLGLQTECPPFSINTGTRFELRFYIYASLDGECGDPIDGDDAAGCAYTGATIPNDPTSGQPPHNEYKDFRIKLKSDTIAGALNHEVGHALGLCDGGDDVHGPDVNYPCNQWGGWNECIGDDSVMHSHGCSGVPDWPTSVDIYTVERWTKRRWDFAGIIALEAHSGGDIEPIVQNVGGARR